MFGNTIVIPHADGDITCIKIDTSARYSSEYLARRATDEVTVRIRHSATKASAIKPLAERHNVEVVQRIFATATVLERERKFYFVIEQQPDDLDIKLTTSLMSWAIASASANVVSLLNKES